MAALSTDGLRSRRKFGVFDAPFEGDFVDLGNEKSKLRELGYIGKLRAIWARHGTWLAPALLTLVSLWTHLYRIGEAKFVVWDEAHFGKFQNYYRKNTFYTDLHPNLGKSLLGFPGWLAGYPPAYNFNFDSEAPYPSNVGFVETRIFCGLLGAAMVPLAYYTCKALGCSPWGSFLGGLVILSDTGLLTITRFILLDPPLLFFTSLSIFGLARFRNYRDRPFSFPWWGYLALTGFSLGCGASVKWIGLFSVAVVGIYTVADLWNLMGDKAVTNWAYIRHWIARIAFLIILPLSVYALVFYIHFAILYKSGPGDAQMHPLFQADLEGNRRLISEQPRAVAYGSKITLHSLAPWGGLLHSHVQTYPKKDAGGHGSGQQQVTGYHHFDENNQWRFERGWPKNAEEGEKQKLAKEGVQYVRDGDIVRLVHYNTKKNLHSHNIKAPMSLWANEVSCYGDDNGPQDPNDNWVVQIMGDVDTASPPTDNFSTNSSRSVVRPVTTRFRLRHLQSGCHFSYHNVILPQWGFKQYEIVCRKEKNADKLGDVIEWAVERIDDRRLPKPTQAEADAVKIPSRISLRNFIKYFYGVNLGMHATNNLLTPEPDKPPSSMESVPAQWPFASVGMRMSGWGENNTRYALLGNIVVWQGGVVALVLLTLLAVFYTIAWRRGWLAPTGRKQLMPQMTDKEFGDFIFGAVGIVVVGWITHFVPFLGVRRVTYLHHYLPCVYYAALGLAFCTDHVLQRYIPSILREPIYIVLMLAIFGVFWYFRDVSFGMTGPVSGYKSRQWKPDWPFN